MPRRKTVAKSIPTPGQPPQRHRAYKWHILFWLAIAYAGLGLISFNIYLLTPLSIDLTFIGLMLTLSSIIGLSTHLSMVAQNAQLNLWVKCQQFMATHKFLSLSTGLGIFLLSPWTMLIGVLIGIFFEKAFPDFLDKTEQIRAHLFSQLVLMNQPGAVKSLLSSFLLKIKQNPGRSFSITTGIIMGLIGGFYSTLFLMPFIAQINYYSFELANLLGEICSPFLLGGFLLQGLLLSTAFALNTLMWMMPTLITSAFSTRTSYLTWEKLRDITATKRQAGLQKIYAINALTKRYYAYLAQKAQTCQQRLGQAKSYLPYYQKQSKEPRKTSANAPVARARPNAFPKKTCRKKHSRKKVS